ncbi:putative ribonuclease H-like domain-containing protein [Tanacetum coccineum]
MKARTQSSYAIFKKTQKIVSQLAILGENISQEDLNLKFLRSLPSEWNTHVVVWRNKPDLDTMSFDDLYNNFKIVEQEVKGTASSSSQNMAFVSSPSISTASTQVSTANLSDDIVYAFLASQPNGSQLVYEDLEQIHKDDIEEMDLKWQLALLSMRTRRGSGVFNLLKMGHFARECRGPRNQDNRNMNQDSSRRTVNVEEISSKAMLAIDGAGFDWSYMADDEVPTNMALMVFSDSEIPDKSGKGLSFVSYNVVSPHPTRLFLPPNLDLSNSGLEEFQQPEFEGYGPKTRSSTKKDKAMLTGILARHMTGTCPISQTSRNLMEDMLPLGEEPKEGKLLVKELLKRESNTKPLAKAVNTACYVQNRVLVVKPHNKTPYELFRGKFDGKSDKGFFVGYSLNTKAFRVYNIRTRKVEENLHVRFLEDKPIIAGTNSNDSVDGSLFDSSSKNASNDEPQPSSDDGKKDDEGVSQESGIDYQEMLENITAARSNGSQPKLDMFSLGDNATLEATHADFFSDETEVDMSKITTTYLVPSTPNTRIHKDHSLDHVIGDVQSGVLTKRMTKTSNEQEFISAVYEGKTHKDLHTCLFACFLSQEEPKKVIQALKDPSWIEAMQEELLQFKLQQVWTLVDLPYGKRAIGTKWVYRNKKDERGLKQLGCS